MVASAIVDHIVPRSQGGGHERANLQGLCVECSGFKTAREQRHQPPKPKVNWNGAPEGDWSQAQANKPRFKSNKVVQQFLSRKRPGPDFK